MTERPEKQLELTTTIAAPLEAVWDALTTGEGLAAWYVSKADVDPRLGGEVAISFGEGPLAISRIDVWEPPNRVRFAYVPEGGMEIGDMEGGSEEWLLSHAAGVTTLRLVHSLPDPGVEDWEGYYGSITRGWTLFLATLRHYLESTERRGRVTTLAMPAVTADAALVWRGIQDALEIGTVEPGTSTTVVVDGERVPAKVLVSLPPLALLLDVDGTLLFADIEGSGEHTVLYTLASTYEADTPVAAHRRAALVEATRRAAE